MWSLTGYNLPNPNLDLSHLWCWKEICGGIKPNSFLISTNVYISFINTILSSGLIVCMKLANGLADINDSKLIQFMELFLIITILPKYASNPCLLNYYLNIGSFHNIDTQRFLWNRWKWLPNISWNIIENHNAFSITFTKKSDIIPWSLIIMECVI